MTSYSFHIVVAFLTSLLLSGHVAFGSSPVSSYGLAYEGSFVYSLDGNGNRTLESIAFDEGRIMKVGNTYAADYHIKDHLGSVRAVVRNGNIIEENDYYPYGAKMAKPGLVSQTSPVPNRYLFSSKEDQAVAFGSYGLDFGARDYAHDGLTWFEPDPLAYKFPELTPYSYCAGNPLKFVDKEGQTPDLAWDLIWVVIDTFNVLKSYYEGDTDAVNQNLKILGADVLAACIPGMVATAGAGVKIAKTTDKVIDTAKSGWTSERIAKFQAWVARGRAFEAKVIKELNEIKNTKTCTVKLDDGRLINTIPDILNETFVGEIKDVKVLNMSDQIRAQKNMQKKTLDIQNLCWREH